MSQPETTTTTILQTLEQSLSELAKILGSSKEEIMKLMSEIDDGTREELLYVLDIYNTYHYEFLDTYIYDVLRMLVSKDRKGRTGIEQTIQSAYKLSNELQDISTGQKIRNILRLR